MPVWLWSVIELSMAAEPNSGREDSLRPSRELAAFSTYLVWPRQLDNDLLTHVTEEAFATSLLCSNRAASLYDQMRASGRTSRTLGLLSAAAGLATTAATGAAVYFDDEGKRGDYTTGIALGGAFGTGLLSVLAVYTRADKVEQHAATRVGEIMQSMDDFRGSWSSLLQQYQVWCEEEGGTQPQSDYIEGRFGAPDTTPFQNAAGARILIVPDFDDPREAHLNWREISKRDYFGDYLTKDRCMLPGHLARELQRDLSDASKRLGDLCIGRVDYVSAGETPEVAPATAVPPAPEE